MKPDEYESELTRLDEEGRIELQPVSARALQRYREVARATMRKDKRINIRISSRDLTSLQKRAIRYGMPYQTLISSILHRYISGELNDEALDGLANRAKPGSTG